MEIKKQVGEKIEDFRYRAESMAVVQFYQKVAKEDNISYNDAVYLCQHEPKYTLGVKIQIYMVDAAIDVLHKKKYLKILMDSLTPEEKKIYDEEVAGLNLTKMVKDAVKGKKR